MLPFPTIWKENCPDSLLDISAKFCVKHPSSFCNFNSSLSEFELKDEISLPEEICERMLNLCVHELNTLDDKFIKIFKDPTRTRLRRVKLRNSKVTDEGIKSICQNNITDLDIFNCLELTSESLKCISKLKSSLTSLVIGNTVQIFSEKGLESQCTSNESRSAKLNFEAGDKNSENSSSFHNKSILDMPFLKHLVLHGLKMPLEKDYFPFLLEPLRYLTHLDLSSCHDLGDLNYLESQKNLTSLILYNVPHLQDAVPSICLLQSLRHLDLSQSAEMNGQYENPNRVLKQITESLCKLVSLDISGTNLAGHRILERDQEDIDIESMKLIEGNGKTDILGLKSRVERPLNFLGLFNTAYDACYRHHIPAEMIAGNANEDQIITAARAYCGRSELIQKVLNDLFHLFRYETCSNPHLALDVVIEAMKQHLTEKHIQISGSASLFYIVKSDYKERFNIRIKRIIIKALLDAMVVHSSDVTMLRNGCLTLIHFKIPEDVFFEYERLVKLLLRIVALHDQDEFVQRIGLYLLNSLACQVDGLQKHLVGDLGAILVMFQLIENRYDRLLCDEVMETAWSMMWNITDETPLNCCRFLEDKGMDLFLRCLRTFPDRPELLRNMMGLLGNVAEVKSLRPQLMKDEYIMVFSELLNSESDGIEVSYNAAGILAHIASDGPELWLNHEISSVNRQDVFQRMVTAIERWDLNTKRNINYRSFEPILRLLCVTNAPEAQYWAVWALANLTRVYPEKYCALLKQEGGIEILRKLLEHPLQPHVYELTTMVLDQYTRLERGDIAPYVED